MKAIFSILAFLELSTVTTKQLLTFFHRSVSPQEDAMHHAHWWRIRKITVSETPSIVDFVVRDVRALMGTATVVVDQTASLFII